MDGEQSEWPFTCRVMISHLDEKSRVGRTEQEMRALIWFGNLEYTKHDTDGVGI